MNVSFDARVMSSAGKKVGRLQGIVVDPDARIVSHVVVRTGRLVSCDRLVPFVDIARCGDDLVELEAGANPRECPTVNDVRLEPLIDQPAAESSSDDPGRHNLRAAIWYPLYGMMAYVRPVRRVIRSNLPERSEELLSSSPVRTPADCDVAQIAGVVAASSGAITHVIATAEAPLQLQRIPIEGVEEIGQDGVVLRDQID